MNLDIYFKKHAAKIDKALLGYLPPLNGARSALHEAMHYAVLSGGKRIRPILTLAACEAVGGDPKRVLPAACALEMIHSYSLAHDDLPCMDNDDLRRGQPTCHKKFGEYTALLAGDALLTLAFSILTLPVKGAAAGALKRQIYSAHRIAQAVGVRGMVGGQAAEMDHQNKPMDLPLMEYIHTHKTGALIAVSLWTGGYLGAGSPKQVEALYRYGKSLGLLFQIVDDILDKEGYAESLGLTETQNEAVRLRAKAQKEVRILGKRAHTLEAIADFILERKS